MKPSRMPTFCNPLILTALLLTPIGAVAQFGHSIPIKLPNGANGMQPELALVYNPGASNGLLGVGWSLTGIPYIARVNYGSGINYAGSDTYAHSVLGILVRQPDGSYRSKKESFTRFVASGQCHDGPCSWTATDPSGMRQHYGTTSDSAKMGWRTCPPYTFCGIIVEEAMQAWGLASVEDLFGNSYTVTYYRSPWVDYTHYRLYPSSISYTIGPGLLASRAVQFGYETRVDTEPGYYRSSMFQDSLQHRLKTIAITSQGHLIRKYRLDYECGDGLAITLDCPGTQTGRSRLKAVTEIGSDGVSELPAQTFTWQTGETGFSAYTSTIGNHWGSAGYTWAADFTGEGRSDLATAIGGSIYVNVGWTNGFSQQVWTVPANWGSAEYTWAGDFNGDGKSDIATAIGGNIYVNISTGYSFSQRLWTVAPNWGGGAFTWARDFNGDGRTDIATAIGGNIYVNLSTGNGFTQQLWPVPSNWNYDGYVWTGDFNGDGKTDIATAIGGNIYVNISTGSSFVQEIWTVAANWGSSAFTWAADFNGDGKTDIATANGGSIYVNISTGHGFTQQLWPVASNWGLAGFTWAADFNGDGRADIATTPGGTSQSVWVNISTGVSFDQQVWSVPSTWGAVDYTRVAEFTGDGKADIAAGYSDRIFLKASSSRAPDLLTKLTNGLSGSVAVAYASATQLPGTVVTSSTGPGIANTAPQQLATRVTTSDGRGGNYAVSYQYSDARVYPGTIPDRRNLGFASVKALDLQTNAFTYTHYNQSPGYEGTVWAVQDYSGSSGLAKEKLHSYELVYPTGTTGVELTRETQETLRVYEFGSFAFSQWTTTSYDDYGHPTLKEQHADGLPTVTVQTTYANDTSRWILGRITSIVTTSGPVILGALQNVWTGDTITAKSEWLDTTNSWLTTTMGYDASGNVTSVKEPATRDGLLRTTTTEFDATFRAYPSRVTNALGHVTEKTYNADGLVTSLTDANGQVVTITYDVFGRKRTESGPGSQYVEYEYRNYGDPARQCNRIAKSVDGVRSLWKEEYFDGTGFKYGITSSGDCASVWVVVDHQKDAAGRHFRTSQPYCYGGTPVWTTTLYDSAGRVASITTPDGKVTQYSHTTAYASVTDANGQVTKKYFNARNQTTSVVDAAGLTTSYGYDALGRLTSITAPDGAMTRIWYDSLNHRTRVEEPQVAATTYGYDAAGNLTTLVTRGNAVTFSYDALNRVTLKQPAGETAVSYVYDDLSYVNARGRVTTVIDASGTTNYSYTPSGQIAGYTKHVDGMDFSQLFTYDWADRVTQITYPNLSHADYTYTNGGALSTLKLYRADTATWADIGTWTDYDASGKPQTVSYGNGVETSYQYDAMGHLTSLLTKKGATVLQDLTYDWYGRPNTGGLNIGSITDKRVNKLCSDGSNTDETQTYSYDSLYRLTQADGVWGTKPYAYNSIGNPFTFGGLTVRTLNHVGQQLTSGTGLSEVTYDPATGNMTHKVLDGVESTYAWTVEGRLSTITKDRRVVAQMTYGAEGQRAKKVSSLSRRQTVTTTYIGRMYEKRTYSDGSPERHTLYLFGNAHLVASVTQTGNIATAYNDANGWRADRALGAMYNPTSLAGARKKLFHIVRALAAHPSAGRWAGGMLFAAAAEWLIVTLFLSFRRRAFTGGISPGLRLASLGIVLAFGFTACSSGPGDRRLASQPILNGDTLLGPTPGTHFYHRNHLNSSSVITDYLGTEETRYVYLPFGELAGQNSCGTDTVTSKFTGQEYDEESGLYYYGARYFDPAIGKFLSPDTVLPSLTDGQTLNRYSYVRNNPIVYIDPTGHFLDFIGDALGAIANAVNYVATAIDRAANWVGEKLVEAGEFLEKAGQYTWFMMKAFGSDPLALAVFVVAVGIAVATLNAPAFVIIIHVFGSVLGSMAAQSIALAAGVTNSTVLSVIGIAGGLLGGGGLNATQLWKSAANFAVAYGLGKLETLLPNKIAERLAPLNSLLAMLIVNGLAKAFGSTPASDAPKDPNANDPTQEQLAGSGGGDPDMRVTARLLPTGQRIDLVISGTLNVMGGAVGFVGAIWALTAAVGWVPVVGWGFAACVAVATVAYGLMQIHQGVMNDGWLVATP